MTTSCGWLKVRVLRPFAHHGRYVGTGERLWLLTHDADVLLETGHVVVIVNGETAPAATDRWVQPSTR